MWIDSCEQAIIFSVLGVEVRIVVLVVLLVVVVVVGGKSCLRSCTLRWAGGLYRGKRQKSTTRLNRLDVNKVEADGGSESLFVEQAASSSAKKVDGWTAGYEER